MSTPLRQREPREECPAFLAFVRRKPCCVCGAPAPSEAAHIKMSSIAHGKRGAGMHEKPSDRWVTPLCAGCHRLNPEAQHNIGEQQFWYRVDIDPCALALKLWGQFERRRARAPAQTQVLKRRALRLKKRKPKLFGFEAMSARELRRAMKEREKLKTHPPRQWGSRKIPSRKPKN